MEGFWYTVLWNNTVRDWLIALGIIAGAMLALRIIQSIVISKIKKLTATTKSRFDDFLISVIQRFVMPMLYVLAIYSAMHYLKLPARFQSVLRVAVMVVVTFYVLRIITAFAGYAFTQGLSKDSNRQREKQARGILLILQVILWCGGILFLVDNLGYDITTLVAGLGIGGIAIALAAQTILGDLFSYLVIFFDKPFEIGDFIIVDDKLGSVEYIGIKTTHIRTLGGEQLIFSNTDLTNSRVHNYKRMAERRVVFSFRLPYDTPRSQLKLVSGWVKQIIQSVSNTRFDRAHLFSFGESSINFEVVYYVLSPDYNIYMDIQQQINLQLMEIFEKENIHFAFPIQKLLVHTEGDEEKTEQP